MARGSLSVRARVSLGSLGLFCLAMLGAIASYGGGSWLQPHAAGHSLLENYWCDLLREPSHSGHANGRAVALATLAFVALGAALWGFWLELARALPEPRASFVRGAGPLSAAATAAVAFLPSDRFPNLHAPVVLLAGGLGLACGLIGSLWAVRHFRAGRAFALCSLVLVALAILNLALYVRVAYFQGPNTIMLPAAQRLATLALLSWMVSGLLTVSASRPTP